jgi:uncharacterized protein
VASAGSRGPLHLRILLDGERLRAPWRILFYLALTAVLTIVGQFALGFAEAPASPLPAVALALAAALLASWPFLARVEERPFGALGFPAHRLALPESAWGMGVGGLLLVAVVALLALTGSVGWRAEAGTVPAYVAVLLGTLLFFGLAAAFEEVIFRGYPFQVLVEWIGAWPATLVASGLFAALHADNPGVGPLALANIFLAGILLSLAYLRTRSLWFATGLHLGWNWTMATLLDLPVSGLVFDTPLYEGVVRGPEWWTGGDFGPEAGLAGSLVLLGGTLWVWRTAWLRPSPAVTPLGPIVDRRLVGEGW